MIDCSWVLEGEDANNIFLPLKTVGALIGTGALKGANTVVPKQMLVHKGGQYAIDHWGQDCRDVTTTKLQCHVYKVKTKKREKKSGGRGVRVSRFGGGGRVRVDVN